MDDTIFKRQNSSDSLLQLAAQKTLYTRAKMLSGFRLFLIVPITILVSIASFVLVSDNYTSYLQIEKKDISWLVATFGVVLAILDSTLITPYIKIMKEKASKIQEFFDCHVYSMSWDHVTVGARPSYELISKYSRSYRKNNKKFESLKNWYLKEASDIPKIAETFICQRSNIVWDSELRSRFSNINILLAVILFIVLLGISLFIGLTLKSFFLTVLAPALPVILYSIRQYYENKEALKELTQLKNIITDTWDKLLNTESTNCDHQELTRTIQSKIYINRKNNPLIFDWFYTFHRNLQHETMYYSVEKLIEEYKKRHNK